MKKTILPLLVMSGTFFLNSAVMADGTDIMIDGIEVVFNDETGYPFISDSRTMVPLRVTMEEFGATVGWEQETQTAVVKKGSTTVRCTVGEMCIRKNGKEIKNDAAASVKNGRTYLPIRAVLEAFGAKVRWDGSVRVTSGECNSLIREIETAPTVGSNYLVVWNTAVADKDAGKYAEAVEKIKGVSSVIVSKGDPESSALMFKTLGDCYSALGESENAAQCFKREAYYWSNLEGYEENRLNAQERYYNMNK